VLFVADLVGYAGTTVIEKVSPHQLCDHEGAETMNIVFGDGKEAARAP
jgi:hypothetical protein